MTHSCPCWARVVCSFCVSCPALTQRWPRPLPHQGRVNRDERVGHPLLGTSRAASFPWDGEPPWSSLRGQADAETVCGLKKNKHDLPFSAESHDHSDRSRPCAAVLGSVPQWPEGPSLKAQGLAVSRGVSHSIAVPPLVPCPLSRLGSVSESDFSKPFPPFRVAASKLL